MMHWFNKFLGPSLFALAVILCCPQILLAQSAEISEILEKARIARAQLRHEQAAHLAQEASAKLKGRQRGYALLLDGLSQFDLGRWDEAERSMSEAQELLPSIRDRISLLRAQAFYEKGLYEESLEHSIKARKSAVIDLVAMQADLIRVESMLESRAAFSVQKSQQFLIRYSSFPQRAHLEYKIARALEDRGFKAATVGRYRRLWRENPHIPISTHAAKRLEILGKSGLWIGRTQVTDILDRARILISKREFDMAEREISKVLQTSKGQARLYLERELAIVAFRRNEIERSKSILIGLQKRKGPIGPWLERCEIQNGDTKGTIRRILGGYAPNRLTPPGKLVRVAEVYIDAGEYEKARRILSFVKMARAPGFMAKWVPWIAFKLGEYDRAIPAFERLQEKQWSRGRRAYWVGRAHHKAGRPCEARRSYEKAISRDSHGYYAVWARKRLGELGAEIAKQQSKEGAEPLVCTFEIKGAEPQKIAWTEPDPLVGWKLGPRGKGPTSKQGLIALNTLIKSHDKALPWLERSRDLWLSGDTVGAGEELRQTLWVSRGTLAPPVALPRLWGGGPGLKLAGRRIPCFFSDSEREIFSTAAYTVDETGLAIRAYRPAWSDVEAWHPLAHEPLVRLSAKRYGLRPELLWSIMRVESYFNRHAISHANAIGLMQFLPRTGLRIARRRGMDNFHVSSLLTPRESLDFAGWYMRALSDRFHGQTPLMIASYNGGPHNVAKWILRRSDTDQPLPMDEFLEEIPFTETYRYVRRVTASMAVYHAYAGLPPPDLPAYVNRDVTQGVNF